MKSESCETAFQGAETQGSSCQCHGHWNPLWVTQTPVACDKIWSEQFEHGNSLSKVQFCSHDFLENQLASSFSPLLYTWHISQFYTACPSVTASSTSTLSTESGNGYVQKIMCVEVTKGIPLCVARRRAAAQLQTQLLAFLNCYSLDFLYLWCASVIYTGKLSNVFTAVSCCDFRFVCYVLQRRQNTALFWCTYIHIMHVYICMHMIRVVL